MGSWPEQRSLLEAIHYHMRILCNCTAVKGPEAKSKGLTHVHTQNPRKVSKKIEAGLLISALGNDGFTEL